MLEKFLEKSLDGFFLFVQFVMLGASIPKVSRLFHAYDSAPIGPLIGGIAAWNWLVGVAIDSVVFVTTAAAMRKYRATGKLSSLLPAIVVIAVCSTLSVVANYEDAATMSPAQYRNVSIFTHPALLINPILVAAPPLIVLLLIFIVPLITANTRTKTVAELEAEAAYDVARLNAETIVKEAKERANAKLRGVRFAGWKDNLSAVAGRTQELPEDAPPAEPDALPDEPEMRASMSTGNSSMSTPMSTARRITKKQWDALPPKERVLQSRYITAAEAAQILGISPAHARKLFQGVRAPDGEPDVPTGRSGAHYQALIEALYARRSPEASAQAHKLERALGIKKTRTLHSVSDAGDNPTVPLSEDDEATG